MVYDSSTLTLNNGGGRYMTMAGGGGATPISGNSMLYGTLRLPSVGGASPSSSSMLHQQNQGIAGRGGIAVAHQQQNPAVTYGMLGGNRIDHHFTAADGDYDRDGTLTRAPTQQQNAMNMVVHQNGNGNGVQLMLLDGQQPLQQHHHSYPSAVDPFGYDLYQLLRKEKSFEGKINKFHHKLFMMEIEEQ
jgi:hypothetical protein